MRERPRRILGLARTSGLARRCSFKERESFTGYSGAGAQVTIPRVLRPTFRIGKTAMPREGEIQCGECNPSSRCGIGERWRFSSNLWPSSGSAEFCVCNLLRRSGFDKDANPFRVSHWWNMLFQLPSHPAVVYTFYD